MRLVAVLAALSLIPGVADARQETVPTASAPAGCPYDGVSCEQVAAAQILGYLGAPFRSEDGLRLPQSFQDMEDAPALETLGAALTPFHVTSERRTLSPRALRDSDGPSIVRIRLPNGHRHFEVHTPGDRINGRFLDLDFSYTGVPTLRPYASLGDVWDGDALFVQRRPSRFDNLALPAALAALFLAAGWGVATLLFRRRRRNAA